MSFYQGAIVDVRTILHWLLDELTVPTAERFDPNRPVADEIRKIIDDVHGYEPPVPDLSADEQRQLDKLLARQREADLAKAEKEAGVERIDMTGGG